jgi:hypothetical protein
MRRFFESQKSIPLVFALVTAAGYGLLLPLTGFYWDDWPFAWIAKFLGPREFIPAFAPFRPFLGPIFYATTSLIPPVPLYWQIFALVVRLVLGLAAWWTFRQIWPERKEHALTAALFMLVFPGYSQHWVAFTHINQELIPLVFYLFSFGFTFKALRSQNPRHTVIALLLQICGLFPTEYFFGLEGLRALFLLSFFQGNFAERLAQTIKRWRPYLLIWILNAGWLVYYYKFGPYNSYEVSAPQALTISALLFDLADSLWKTGFYIWIQALVLTFSSLAAPASLLTLGLVAVSFAFLLPYLRSQVDRYTGGQVDRYTGGQVDRYTGTQVHKVTRNTQRPAPTFILHPSSFILHPSSFTLIGILGILLGRLPSLAAGLPLTLQSSYDRFMVSMMIGGSLFALGLIELIFGKSGYKIHVIALIAALGVGQQFFNANIFRRDWAKQREIYWQMAWRIPALQPGTVLLTHQMPIDYETDMSFTAPINWMYAPDFQGTDLPYLMLYTEKRLGGSTLRSLDADVTISFPYRTVTFRGNTSQAVVIYMPRNGCLRVLDPWRGDAEVYARESKYLVEAIPLSDLSRIVTETDSPAMPAFLAEPEHNWCYYFTKAELAYQMNDLERVTALGNEALTLGYSPEDAKEWLIFIEANALTGNLEEAEALSMRAMDEDARTDKGLCIVWKRVQTRGHAGSEEIVQKMLSQLDCNP